MTIAAVGAKEEPAPHKFAHGEGTGAERLPVAHRRLEHEPPALVPLPRPPKPLQISAEPSLAQHRHKLAIVIPCFNECGTILEIIEQVRALPVDKSILVVDNCSTDGTRERLRAVCNGERTLRPSDGVPSELAIPGQTLLVGDGFTVVLQPCNLRKAASVRLGLALANSEYVVCQDADLEYEPTDILRLLEHAERTGAAAVFGSRLSGAARVELDAFQVGRIALTKLFQVLYRSDITDVATCYKLMRTEVARALNTRTSGFDLDFEIPARLRLNKHRIADVPIRYHPRGRNGGKKIRWRDGVSAAFTLLRMRLL